MAKDKDNKFFRSKRESSFDTFKINKDQAKKDFDSVVDYWKKSLGEYGDDYKDTNRQIRQNSESTFSAMYDTLTGYHRNYLNGLINRERAAAAQVQSIWSNVNRGGNITVKTVYESQVSGNPNQQIVGSNGQPLYSSPPPKEEDRINTDVVDKRMSQLMDEYESSQGSTLKQYQNKLLQGMGTSIREFADVMNADQHERARQVYDEMRTNLINQVYLGEVELDSTEFINEWNKITKGYSDVNTSFNKTTLALNVASIALDGVSTALNIFIGRFFDGADRIYQMYESTYSRVSVLMDENQSDYRGWQKSLQSEINDMGLKNNLAISTVMQELETVVNLGLTGQAAQSKALSDSITKSIAPYIEVTSDAFTDLQMKFGDEFVSTMRGIGKATNDNVGQSRFIAKNLDSMLTSLEPVFLNARSDQFDKQFAEQAAILEGLVAEGAMSSEMAESYKQQVYNLTMDQYGTLQNGSASDIITLTNLWEKGIDPAEDITATLKENLNVVDDMMGMFGSDDAYNTLYKNIGAQQLIGTNDATFYNFEALEEIFENAAKAVESNDSASRQLLENYANDKYTTETEQKNIKAENNSLAVAQFHQQYPDAYRIIEGIWDTTKTILSSLAGYALLKGGGNLLSGLSGGGSGGALGTAGSTITGGLQNLGGGLATGTAGSVGSGLVVVGGATAGVAMAGYGGYQAYQDFTTAGDAATTDSQRDAKIASGTLNATGAVGGAVGAGALVALGASNPVGWVALALGGVALGGAKLVQHMTREAEITQQLSAAFEENRDSTLKQLEAQTEYAGALKDSIQSITDEGEARQLLIQNDLLTAEEAEDMTMGELTSYAAENEKHMERIETIFEDLSKASEKDAKEESEFNFAKNYDAIRKAIEAEDDVDTQKQMLLDLGFDEKTVNKLGKKTWNDWNGVSVDNILNGGWHGLSKKSLQDLTEEDVMNNFIDKYSVENGIKTDYTAKAYQQTENDKMLAYLTEYKLKKEAGNLTTSEKSKYDEYKKTLKENGVDVSSYKKGISYVAEDEELAYLHQGERVLTKEENETYMANNFGSNLLSRMQNLITGNVEESNDYTDSIADAAALIVKAVENGAQLTQEAITTLKQAQSGIDWKNKRLAPAGADYDMSIINLKPITRSDK